jgi:hypothetical protein
VVGVRGIALLVVLGLAAIACGGSDDDPCANAGSTSVLLFGGEERTGVAVDDLRPLPPVVRTVEAQMGSCAERSTMRAEVLRGVPPEVALARDSANRQVARLYPAEGFFLTLPSHPLHRWLYRRDDRPDLRQGKRCKHRATQHGVVRYVSGWEGSITLARSGAQQHLRIDAKSALDLPSTGGLPRLRVGQRVRVESNRCGASRLVATRVSLR